MSKGNSKEGNIPHKGTRIQAEMFTLVQEHLYKEEMINRTTETSIDRTRKMRVGKRELVRFGKKEWKGWHAHAKKW